MAQDFIGTNNLNLLMPIGQFGSRNGGSKEAASPRYIYTNLSPLTRYIFQEVDNAILNYLEDDGQKVEPSFYAPILPMVLVNGIEGIGVGWSTSLPCYNPLDLVDRLLEMLQEPATAKIDNEKFDGSTVGGSSHSENSFEGKIQNELENPENSMKKELLPWYRGFFGKIERNLGGNSVRGYNVHGDYELYENCKVKITELPVGTWTKDYKQFLMGMMEGGNSGNSNNNKAGNNNAKKTKEDYDIKDLKEYHTRNSVCFELQFREDKFASFEKDIENRNLNLSIADLDKKLLTV